MDTIEASNGDVRPAAGSEGNAPGLLDLLPVDPVACAGTQTLHHPIASIILAAVEDCARRLDTGVPQLLAAAMVLVESRLTGSSAVVATVRVAGRQRWARVPVPEGGAAEAWLRACLAAMAEPGSGEPGEACWLVADTLADPAFDERQPVMAWQLATSGEAAGLTVRFPPSVGAVAAAMLAGWITRCLATLSLDLPDKPLPNDLVCEGERMRQLRWNATARPRLDGDTVIGLFEEMAERFPDAPAVVDGLSCLSYRQLDRRANALAARLAEAGTCAGSIVGIARERSAAAVVALLAVLKTGAAYLPLEASNPVERTQFMLRDAGVQVVLSDEANPRAVPAGVRAMPIGEGEADGAPGPRRIDSHALAYVMYTSGSTGEPKAVEIEHRSIIRLVRGVDYVHLGPQTRFLHAAPLGFDASTLELWGPLLNGGCVVVHPEAVPSAAGLAAVLSAHGVTTAWLTAALFNAIIDEAPQSLQGLRQLLTGGEALSVRHVRIALGALAGTELINGYGPTECTTFATTYAVPRDLDAAARSIPIGRPIPDTTVHVLNPRLQRVPIGVTGELFIGGAGLARGYRNQPQLTAERFVASPFDAGERLYRTGDLVRQLADGNLEFVGRADTQVKIHGHRIELGEIEAALARHDGVAECAVLAREDRAGERRLVAYFKPGTDATGSGAPTAPQLRQHLARVLPAFMVPAIYVQVKSLPVTANGKLDRRALPVPEARRPELAVAFEPPVGPVETRLCQCFADVLDIDQVGRHDNFFDLGGSSLLVLQLLARIKAGQADPALSATAIFDNPTPAGLARVIAGEREPAATRVVPAVDHAPSPHAPSPHAPSPHEPIAIVAMAGRFPGARNVEQFWENLCEGRESITMFKVEELDPGVPPGERNDPEYVMARGILDEVESFDAGFFGISPREAELMDPQQRIFLELCWECIERSGQLAGEREPVGVFAGMYHSTYWHHHVQAHPDLVDKLGAFQVMLDNEKDFIATRVAHKLDLTGPAISMYTGCSTSLVAVSQAVDSLRAGHCDMALAGGIAITCPPRSGYLHQEGAMLSPDGHTRTFDHQAQGTVFSDGAAVVLLKRLSDALRDGNPIHSVILGSAVNNDGGAKASFTAPSSEGQATVIANAQADAGVPARSIGYLEAHGTATPMGDPIEIEGLVKAFRRSTGDTGFCRIGSVKSNIGHLVIAAGTAGLIKTAFALSRQQIPPTLHFTQPNPAIDFAGSPFVVNASLSAWGEDGGTPRRAGVSSFGVGGTNAHVVLQEPPERPASEPASGPSLLVLSARSQAALGQAAAQLADFLEARTAREATPAAGKMSEPMNLADVAWTLAEGRKPFAHRVALVCDHAAEAIDQLRSPEVAAAIKRGRPARHCDPVFMFPGQGSHYAGMGRALYEAEPEFGAGIDECVDAMCAGLGLDHRKQLFSDDPEALLPTAVMQPAIFSLEYALARMWMRRGVQPVAMVGHSVGEFVAATLAGVFSLADAIVLVARRGALMQARPAGAMLTVRMPLAALLERLPADLSLAAENAPGSCVVSGEHEAIARFSEQLAAEGIACRELRTSHAFHSAMMDPVVAPFRELVAATHRSPPKIPIVSSATGEWLDAETAMSPDYWARHLREPVRFAPALSRLLETPDPVLLEIGPRATLAGLARQHPDVQGKRVAAIASLGDAVDSETASIRLAAGQLWCQGLDLRPGSFDARSRRHRLLLPTYPFERQRHWVDAAVAGSAQVLALPTAVPAVAATADAPASAARVTAEDVSQALIAVAPDPDNRPSLFAELAAVFEDVAGFGISETDGDCNFMELGLDSLMLTQVALQLQKTFKVRISFRELMGEGSSLERLAALLVARMPARPAADVRPPAAVPPAAAVTPGSAAPPPARAATPAPAPAQAAAAKADVAPEASGADEVVPMLDKYDVKKAFGAIARIDTQARPDLSPVQRRKLDDYIARYVARTARSKQYTEQHRAHLADPRVVNGFRPLLKEIVYQIVIERSKGAHLWDLDGNRYVDALNGFGMSLFGWQPDFVLEAVRRQLDLGYEIGPQHPLAGEVAALLCEVTGHDRAALCNTGSEAVLGALRIARTVTGRNTVVVFSGSYHGIVDEMIVRAGKNLRAMPAAPGILRNTAEHVLVLDYGTPESLDIIRARGEDIAAVLVEPVQSRRPDFQPMEFLRSLRRLTREVGAVYVFDEVVTGFRVHPRGAQGLFGIQADLATYGKVVGGGFPIGVIAGASEFMDALDGGPWQFGDDSMPMVGVTYFAGTFVRHPLALAAAKAVLGHLRTQGSRLQEDLGARTSAMVGEINQFCAQVGAPLSVKHFGSVWKTQFLEDHPFQDLLFGMMRSRGVHILDNFPCFLTTAHDEADCRQIVQAFKESVVQLQDAEFLPRKAATPFAAMAARPPAVAGARLGREPDGSPAWFVPNPEQPGRFMRLGT
jgi:amino acid adenylation domain-containing protein